ncbi:MAG: dicarboxylate/amino acid:cation symporter [Pseudomonadota bacterium]
MPLHRQIFIALIVGILLAAGLTYVEPAARALTLDIARVIGNLFLNALKAVALPLVVVTLIAGIGNLNQRLGRLGALAISFYGLSTLLAVLVGLFVANVIAPGLHATAPAGGWLASAGSTGSLPALASPSWADAVLAIVPANLFKAASDGNLLALVLFALLLGMAIRTLPEALRDVQRQFWDGLQQVLLTLVLWLLKAAPIGVAALVCNSASQMGWAALQPLAWFMATVIIGLLIHAGVSLGLVLWQLARVSPRDHARAMSPALWMAFSTASSTATLPLTLRCLNERAGVDPGVTSLTVPLGATLNMDGTALYECVAVLFLAQLLGFDLSLADQVVVVALSLATSIGMAGIPAASLVAIALILQRLGMPAEALGLLLITDRPLDMCRTAVNVWSDSVAARMVARFARGG